MVPHSPSALPSFSTPTVSPFVPLSLDLSIPASSHFATSAFLFVSPLPFPLLSLCAPNSLRPSVPHRSSLSGLAHRVPPVSRPPSFPPPENPHHPPRGTETYTHLRSKGFSLSWSTLDLRIVPRCAASDPDHRLPARYLFPLIQKFATHPTGSQPHAAATAAAAAAAVAPRPSSRTPLRATGVDDRTPRFDRARCNLSLDAPILRSFLPFILSFTSAARRH